MAVRRRTAGAIVALCVAGSLAPQGEASAAGAPPRNPDADFMGSSLPADERPGAAKAAPAGVGVNAVGVQGIDVSHWQGTMDWNAVAANGTRFAYLKATEGVTFVDQRFATNYAGSYDAGLLRGAYHFALPDVSSGAAQANYFVDHGGTWTPDGRTLPPVLDIEYNPYGDTCFGFTQQQMVAWVADFVTTMRTRIGRAPMIYTTRNWWNLCTGNNPGFGLNSPLWIAGYHDDPSKLPFGWGAYTMWQYASSPIDQDVFNGTIDELRALATGSPDEAITAHHNRLGGAAGWLGAPVGSRSELAGGFAQDYANGTVYYSSGSGAWAVNGLIRTGYRQRGGPGGPLGFPGTDEGPTADGVGRFNHFQNGSIYWTPDLGAHDIRSAIRATWAALGWERTELGYPITDDLTAPDGVAHYNHFQRGSIYWTPSTGANEIRGFIKAKWASMDFERSVLRYPITNELGTPDGIGRYNHFQEGSIYWTPSTGAHEIHGYIRALWQSLGWERSVLGYPTTDETATPDRAARYSHFEGGSIYWTPDLGAHEIHGAIKTKWGSLDWERSFLGYPTTNETATPDGVGRYNHFQGGSIYWTAATGAHEIHGAIKAKWGSLDWERSFLGYPTSDEFAIPGGARSNFQGGYITWSAATGVATAFRY